MKARDSFFAIMFIQALLFFLPLFILLYVWFAIEHYYWENLLEHAFLYSVLFIFLFSIPTAVLFSARKKQARVWLWYIIVTMPALCLLLWILRNCPPLIWNLGPWGWAWQLLVLFVLLSLPTKEQRQEMANEERHKFFQWFKMGWTNVRKVVLFFVILISVGLVFYLWRVWSYSLPEDTAHLMAKEKYLQQIRSEFSQRQDKPNIILILFDDLGYGDLGVYGAKAIRTPNIDRVASEGVRLTDFYSASPVCSPSRAGLMTGRYPPRTGIEFILYPSSSPIAKFRKFAGKHAGLPREEITIADVLKAAGYATAMFGKWHLGDESPTTPNDFGFDSFYGAYCSNDMIPMHLYRDGKIIENHPVDQTRLTENYTKGAIQFIRDHHKQPFFLYIPHTFPHIPLYPAKEHEGKSPAGKYGDVVEDLDRSVAEIIATLESLGIAENTLVILTSDNGPWYQGSAGLARGRKMEVFEGGVRVPFIAKWPGKIPPGLVVKEPAMGVDILPTILALLQIPLPEDRVIDGTDIFPILQGKTITKRDLYFFWKTDLYAVREGKFKYHTRHRVGLFNPAYPAPWTTRKGPWLFDMTVDSSESYDVSTKYPKVVQQLHNRVKSCKVEIQQNVRGWK